MKCVLLCAGFGTRLDPLTRKTAKPLLEVAGRPIVEHLAQQLAASAYVDQVTVVSNGRFFDQFRAWAKAASVRIPEMRFDVLNDGAMDDRDRLGAVGDLYFAVSHQGLGEPMLVAAGDNLFRVSFRSLVEDYFSRPRNLVLAYRETHRERLRRTAVAEIDAEGRVRQLWEKPEDPPTDWACPAVYILEGRALAELPTYLAEGGAADALGQFISWLVARQPVHAHHMKGRRLEIGNLDSFRLAESWLKSAEEDAL